MSDCLNDITCPKCWSIGHWRNEIYEWKWECGYCGFLWNRETRENGFGYCYWDNERARRYDVDRGLLVVLKEVEL